MVGLTEGTICLTCLMTLVKAQESSQLLVDKFLLVADEGGDKILQVDAKTMMTHRLSIIMTSQPQVLAYDWLRHEIYWTSGIYRGAIFKYSFARNETLEFWRDTTPTTIYSGLALDVQRHLLYFTNEGQGQVAELELKLKLNLTADANSRIIDSTNHSRPRCVAVDSFNRLLYWVDFREDTQAGIYAYSLNDATKSRLVPNVQIRPRTIGFDFADQVMYFDDYKRHSFNVLNLTDEDARPRTLWRVGSLTPFSIAVDAEFVYLANRHPRVIKKINRSTETAVDETLTGTFSAYGLVVFSSSALNRTTPLLGPRRTTTVSSHKGAAAVYAVTKLIMIIVVGSALSAVAIAVAIAFAFTARRRRNRLPSVGITSVRSWDASVHVATRTQRSQRPKSPPPLPPLRSNVYNDDYNQYDDARTAVDTTVESTVEQEAEYLKPVNPYAEENDEDYLYSDAGDPRRAAAGNGGYIELTASYHEYSDR